MRTVGDLNNVPKALPGLVQLSVVPQAKFISNGEPDLSRFQLRQVEPSDPLLVETHVPAHDERLLRLRLLETLVVVGFDLDERAEDVLVLIRDRKSVV